MFRKIVIGVGAFVGIALIVLSFLDQDVPTAPSSPEEERSGQLQLDTVPLGALTLVADGVVAGCGVSVISSVTRMGFSTPSSREPASGGPIARATRLPVAL